MSGGPISFRCLCLLPTERTVIKLASKTGCTRHFESNPKWIERGEEKVQPFPEEWVSPTECVRTALRVDRHLDTVAAMLVCPLPPSIPAHSISVCKLRGFGPRPTRPVLFDRIGCGTWLAVALFSQPREWREFDVYTLGGCFRIEATSASAGRSREFRWPQTIVFFYAAHFVVSLVYL